MYMCVRACVCLCVHVQCIVCLTPRALTVLPPPRSSADDDDLDDEMAAARKKEKRIQELIDKQKRADEANTRYLQMDERCVEAGAPLLVVLRGGATRHLTAAHMHDVT